MILINRKYIFEHIKISLSELFTKNKLKQEQYVVLERVIIIIIKVSNFFYYSDDLQDNLNQLIEIMGTIPGKFYITKREDNANSIGRYH
jgi:hypothetical protein